LPVGKKKKRASKKTRENPLGHGLKLIGGGRGGDSERKTEQLEHWPDPFEDRAHREKKLKETLIRGKTNALKSTNVGETSGKASNPGRNGNNLDASPTNTSNQETGPVESPMGAYPDTNN